MSHEIWEHFFNMPRDISTEEARALEKEAVLLDVRGEVCPYPQIEAKKALGKLTSGKILVVYTDHVDAVENVPQGVRHEVSKVKVWKSGKGEYKLFLWRR
jgi:TusA-related sulfurtransferase